MKLLLNSSGQDHKSPESSVGEVSGNNSEADSVLSNAISLLRWSNSLRYLINGEVQGEVVSLE